MTIETSMRTFVLADSDVSALVSTRMYPVKMPQSFSLPAITYQRIGGDRPHETAGATGRVDAEFQIDCFADNYDTIRDLAAKVRKRLDGHYGTMGSDNVGYVHCLSERDMFEDNTEIYRVSMDFLIKYTEST